MNIVSGVTLFVVIWWMVFLMCLPFGSNPPAVVEKGHATSAPQNPRILKKAVVATVLSIMLFVIACYFITTSSFSFRSST